MENATEKQVQTLKSFARNPVLNQTLFRGVEFEKLNKKEASEFITQCYAQNNVNEDKGFHLRYSQNYKVADGKYRTVTLTDQELFGVREAHRKHCQQILSECKDDYPTEPGNQQCVFHKRCDKIYTWIQLALDEKVRKERFALRTKFYPANELNSQTEI
jgi:hypothetical protein